MYTQIIERPEIECHRETDTSIPESLSQHHCHDTYEILYVSRGRGKFFVEGSRYEMMPGTIMLSAPFEYHSVEVQSGMEYDRYVLHFSYAALTKESVEILKSLQATGDERGCHIFPAVSVLRQLTGAMERLEDVKTLPKEKQLLYAKTVLSEIIVLISTAGADRRVPDESELAVRVLRYINDRMDKNLSLDAIAKHFFVSKYYLCRAFKKYNGISIHGYMTQKKVMYAKRLIESGETASGAAYRVGFGDYSAFYRAYVKLNGNSPAEVIRGKERN